MYYLIIAPVILVIICMLLVIIFGHDWYNYLTSFLPVNEDYKNRIHHPMLSSHFNNYMKSIHPDIYSAKLPTFKHFNKDYMSSIKELPNKYVNMINDYTTRADKLVDQFKIFDKYPWKIYASYNNLEMNMPFTIDNSIIIPIRKLEQLAVSHRHGHYDNSFINILIHEKIHVIQRDNQSKFDRFYLHYYKSFLGEKYNTSLPDTLHRRYMNNPDSNNSIWLFRFNNKEYIPLLTYQDDSIKTIGYNKNNISDTIDLNYMRKQLGYGSDISFYHPNEIFACDVAHHIMDNTILSEYDTFIKGLS